MIRHFSLIVTGGDLDSPVTDDQLLDATDAVGNAGCTDCSVMAHREGLELTFHREGNSLDEALSRAVRDVQRTGLVVLRVELNQEAIAESLTATS